MATLFLLTDFGANGIYAGVLHAVASHARPPIRVEDLGHDIPPGDVPAASFLLEMTLAYTPPGSVVVAVIDPGVGSARAMVVVSCGDRWIVAPDNGLACEAVASCPEPEIWALDAGKVTRASPVRIPAPAGATFDGRDVLVPAGLVLASGKGAEAIGSRRKSLSPLEAGVSIEESPGELRAPGRWIDRFGNVLTALGSDQVARFARTKPVRVFAGSRDLGAPVGHYAARPPGELMAVFNSWGRLELACNGGSAAKALGVVAPLNVTIAVCREG